MAEAGGRRDSAARGLEAMEKYMNTLPPHLLDLVASINADRSTLPAWHIEMLDTIKAAIQSRLDDHFETCAMTRQKFCSMPEEIWKEEETGKFVLRESPRKILGYLPKVELSRLGEMVRNPVTTAIEEIRTDLYDLMNKMRASESDRDEIAELVARDSFFFADLQEHHDAQDKWNPLLNQKEAVINYLKEREEFLEEIEEFETKASGDKDRYKKANSLALADENKFRAYAAKKLKEMDSMAIKMCRKYEEDTGREFQIDGVKYLEMIKEQKFGRLANPGLNLGKLAPEAITAKERAKFEGGIASNLVSQKDGGGMKKRTSMMEKGVDPKIIRAGDQPSVPEE